MINMWTATATPSTSSGHSGQKPRTPLVVKPQVITRIAEIRPVTIPCSASPWRALACWLSPKRMIAWTATGIPTPSHTHAVQ
jgi:hypothetical protein